MLLAPLDAQHLAEDLAAHHFGRSGLLCPVRIPSVEEELRRLPALRCGDLFGLFIESLEVC